MSNLEIAHHCQIVFDGLVRAHH